MAGAGRHHPPLPKGNTPFGTFEAVYTGTQEPVPGLTGADCGELLLGVGREVFERSAFLGQSGSLAIQSTRSWSGASPPWCPPGRRTCPTPRRRGA